MTSARSLLDFISSSQHLGNELKLLYKDPFPRPHSVLIHHSRQYVLRASFAFYPSSNWHKTYSVLWKSVSAALIYISHKHWDKRKANNCDRGMMYDGSEDSFYPGPVSPSQITWTDPEAAHNIRTAFYRVLSLYLTQRIKPGLLLTRFMIFLSVSKYFESVGGRRKCEMRNHESQGASKTVHFHKNVPTIKTVLIKISKTQLMRLKL